MRGDADDGARERRACLLLASAPQLQRADRVPGVCGAFARVQLSRMLRRELAFEVVERTSVVAARQANQPAQPVQGNWTEPRPSGRLAPMRGEAAVEFAPRLVEHLARNVDGRGKPVRERKV